MLVHRLEIDATFTAFSLKGELQMFKKNPTYGSGFKGMIKLALFNAGINVKAVGQFGKMPDYRYFYTDAMVGFSEPLPFITPLAFYGFGGGVYYNVEQQGVADPFPRDLEKEDTNVSTPGTSLSGITYIPKDGMFGLKASTLIGLQESPKAFNADAAFQIMFDNGSLKEVKFTGGAYFVKDIYDEAESANLWGDLDITYNNDEKFLHAICNTYVDLSPVMVGANEGKKAGTTDIYISKENWHVMLGQPDEMMSVKMFKFGSFEGLEAGNYLMAGNDIPDIPDIAESLNIDIGSADNEVGSSSATRESGSLESGKGLAFGSKITFDTNPQKFLIFYGQFGITAGYDIMLKNYEDAICGNTGKKPGINGWYASGNAYGVLNGKIGIETKLFRKKIKQEIFSVYAYAVLQAKLPKPTWMQGAIGGDYKILGGLIKGHCDFEFEVGEPCEVIDYDPLANIQIIADATPDNKEKNVSVFNKPQIIFNLSIGEEFELEDENGEKILYRAVLDFFELRGEEDNAIVDGELQWNDDKTVVIFYPLDILPPEQSVTLKGQIHFEQKNDGGEWQEI